MNIKKQTFVLLLIIVSLYVVSCSGTDTSSMDKSIPNEIEISKTEPPPSTPTTQATSTIGFTEATIPPTQSYVPIAQIDKLDQGTYLTYAKPGIGEYELVFVSSDGNRMMSHSFPVDNPYSLANTDGVSPDGKYYAFYSGTAGEWGYMDAGIEHDLILNIIALGNGSTVLELPLLSEDYPNNFEESVASLRGQLGTEYEMATDYEVALGLYYAFLSGIGSHEWSPDSRYLAFAGQMEGQSSDLYLLDTYDFSIRRLTSGPEQIQRITWSPDSKNIMHASTNWIGVNPPFTNHSARADGSGVVSFPYDEGELEDGWLNENQYLAHEGANGIGTYDIKIFDVRDGTLDVIWPYPFQFYNFHPSRNVLLVTMVNPPSNEMDPGVFLVDPDSKEFTRLETGLYTLVEPLKSEDYLYAVGQWDHGTYLLTTDYNLESLSNMNRHIKASPDFQLLALYGFQDSAGLDIYSIEDKSIVTVFDSDISWVLWTPDQSGLFFASGDILYYFDILSGRTVEIDEANENQYPKWGGLEFIQVEH